jgi:hypothetical protein
MQMIVRIRTPSVYTLLVILCTCFVTAASSVAKRKKLPPIAFDIDHSEPEAVLLRGSLPQAPPIAQLQLRQQKQSIVALQTSKRSITRRKRGFANFLAKLRTEAAHKVKARTGKVDLCDGNRYRWIVQIRGECKDSFGEDSVWDKSRSEGACEEAWDECNSRFAAECCTQPEGPQNINAYCERERGRNQEDSDRACDVQGEMSEVQGGMQGIRDEVALMDVNPLPWVPPTQFQVIEGDCKITDGGRCVVSPHYPEDYQEEEACEIRSPSKGVIYPRVKVVAEMFKTEGCCDKLTIADDSFGGDEPEDAPDHELHGPEVMTWTTDFSTNGVGWKVCAQDIPPAAPAPPAWWGPGPAPPGYEVGAPPSAAPPGILGPHSPAYNKKAGPKKPSKLETQCQKLTGLVKKIGQHVDGVRKWAVRDGVEAPPPAQHSGAARGFLLQTFHTIAHFQAVEATAVSEAKDPDLVFAMRKVLMIGNQLDAIRNSKFCGRFNTEPEDEDDDEEDDWEPSPAPGPAAMFGDRADYEEEEEEEEETEVNGTAITSLLEWEHEMKSVVDKYEGGVHPHGRKWWRYRYEYTLVESFVLAWDVMMLFGVMWILHGVSFFGKFKFYKIGLTSRLFRYAWGYMIFHAAALMFMATIAYTLYMPWGEYNIYDYCAKRLHEWVDGRANVPYMGYSWLRMVMDVLFQLLACFAIYAIFIVFATLSFQRALNDWKAFADTGSVAGMRPINRELITLYTNSMKMRVRDSDALQSIFRSSKLRLEGVVGDENSRVEDWHDFKMHLYLTDALGMGLEYLVEVSLKTNIILALSALVVALLAHHYQVAFMYFLPIFVVMGFVMFLTCFLISRHLRGRSKGEKKEEPLTYLTVHSYCRSVQIVLYCVFFGFARLLLSNDIFTDYPRVYLAAFLGLVLTILCSWFVAGEVMKETICAIVIPPNISEQKFKSFLGEITQWYKAKYCHECGVRQLPTEACLSREWANVMATREPNDSGTDRSGGAFSFR